MNFINIPIDIIYIYSNYLSYRSIMLLFLSCKFLYNKLNKNTLEEIYFTPKSYDELKSAVNLWYNNQNAGIKIYNRIEFWNTVYIEDMSELFYLFKNFNENINDWIVNNVKYMILTFAHAGEFNKPLDKWNTMNVKSMAGMFCGAKNFNQCIENWNVSNVSDMHIMFKDADKFNKLLNNWNINNVKDTSYMFYNATMINKSLLSWNIDKIEYTKGMFDKSILYN